MNRTTTLLASIPDEHTGTVADSTTAVGTTFKVVFAAEGFGVAYVTRVDESYHVVHNGRTSRPVDVFDQMEISPDGNRVAFSGLIGGSWRMLIDDTVGLPSIEVGGPLFSPDGQHVAYGVKQGKQWYLAVDNTLNMGCDRYCSNLVFSGDSSSIAYIEVMRGEDTHRLIVADLDFSRQVEVDSVVSSVVPNEEHTRIAAVREVDGKQAVLDLSFMHPDDQRMGAAYDSIGDVSFGPDGHTIAYVAEKDGKRFIRLDGNEETLPDGELSDPPVVRPDGKAVGLVLDRYGQAFLYEAFVSGEKDKPRRYDQVEDLVYGPDGARYAYVARSGEDWFVVVNGREGPRFDRVVTPVFSPDGEWLVYRVRHRGKRFVVVAGGDGKVLRQHPPYEQVHMPAFTTDGKSVAYGVKEGNQLIWKVEELPVASNL